MTAEPDQMEGAEHPRLTYDMIGHDDAEAALADALGGARMHHAWLITGARHLGKATLAYRAARVALGARRVGARPLDVDPEDHVVRRISALSHPDLFILRRGLNDRGRPKRDISADDARALSGFFAMAPAEGGMRIAIVDAVDDLNRFAANAILKTLEEPPPRTMLLLVCHSPGAVLPTIRSRCRKLSLRPLADDLIKKQLGDAATPALIRAAKGRPGFAALLAANGGALAEQLQRDLAKIAERGPAAVLSAIQEHGGGEEALALTFEIAGDFVRAKALEEGPSAARWAEAWSALEQLRRDADEFDMDPQHALARAAGLLDRAAAGRP